MSEEEKAPCYPFEAAIFSAKIQEENAQAIMRRLVLTDIGWVTSITSKVRISCEQLTWKRAKAFDKTSRNFL